VICKSECIQACEKSASSSWNESRKRAATNLMEDGHAELLKSDRDILAERPPVSLFSGDSTTSFRSIGSFGVEVDGVDGVPAGEEGERVSSSSSSSSFSSLVRSFRRLTSCKA